MKRRHIPIMGFFLLLLSFTLPGYDQSKKSAAPPELIRDTGVAEGKDTPETPVVKERNPKLAKQNIDIGNYYFKDKNYVAAIRRYLEAIEYQPDSIKAFEALANAYEKNGEITKAVDTYKSFLDKNPDLPENHQFRIKLAKLEKKTN